MSDSTLLIPANEERRREAMKTRRKITVLTIIQILAYPAGFASTIPFLGQEGILIIILPLFLFLFVPFIVIKILGRIKSKLWAKINDTIYDEVTYPAMASAFSLREDTRNENFQTEDILSSGLLDFTWNDYTCGFFIRGESGGFPVSYARLCFSYITPIPSAATAVIDEIKSCEWLFETILKE